MSYYVPTITEMTRSLINIIGYKQLEREGNTALIDSTRNERDLAVVRCMGFGSARSVRRWRAGNASGAVRATLIGWGLKFKAGVAHDLQRRIKKEVD